MKLDGTGSADPGGGTVTYEWRQTGGPTVTLTRSNPEGSQAEFIAPLVASRFRRLNRGQASSRAKEA